MSNLPSGHPLLTDKIGCPANSELYIFCIYLFLCVFVCGVACVWMSAEVWEPIFFFAMWVLGSQLRFSGR